MDDAPCFASAVWFGRESEEWNEKERSGVLSLVVIKKAVNEKHKAQSTRQWFQHKGNAIHQTESTVSVSS